MEGPAKSGWESNPCHVVSGWTGKVVIISWVKLNQGIGLANLKMRGFKVRFDEGLEWAKKRGG